MRKWSYLALLYAEVERRVGCEFCDSAPGEACAHPNGNTRGQPHNRRLEAARVSVREMEQLREKATV